MSVLYQKNQKKSIVLFRCDSSSSIGLGHVMRDLVLAKRYKQDGNKIYFATQELEGNINSKIPYEIITLKSNNIDELDNTIKQYDINLLVIDHYNIDYEFEKQLKIKNPTLKILSFDDTYEKHYCDILLNHNISADETRYKNLVPEYCELRCGEKYTLIRDEFIEEKTRKRAKIYDVFIAMGGADTANLNIKILESLPKEFKVAIVTTKANKNLDELKEYVANYDNITLHVDSNKIAKLINQSKLAIVTPSVMVHEVLFLGVPFIAIKTADNQRDMSKYLKQKRYKVFESFEKWYNKQQKGIKW